MDLMPEVLRRQLAAITKIWPDQTLKKRALHPSKQMQSNRTHPDVSSVADKAGNSGPATLGYYKFPCSITGKQRTRRGGSGWGIHGNYCAGSAVHVAEYRQLFAFRRENPET